MVEHTLDKREVARFESGLDYQFTDRLPAGAGGGFLTRYLGWVRFPPGPPRLPPAAPCAYHRPRAVLGRPRLSIHKADEFESHTARQLSRGSNGPLARLLNYCIGLSGRLIERRAFVPLSGDIPMSKTYLKIKIMSLAAEARIIRREEKKWPGPHDIRTGLHLHRVHDVRDEARAALLAYGFIRGRAYAQLEANPRTTAVWQRAAALATKYGDRKVVYADFEAWAAGEEPVQAAA